MRKLQLGDLALNKIYVGLLASLVAFGCGGSKSNQTTPTGSGGTTNAGGTTGSGGKSGSGGTTGAGGTASSGGTTGAGGATGGGGAPPKPVLTGTVGDAAMTCAQMPLPTTGKIYYACDCGSGADPSCQAGSDSNAGTSADKPWQTYTKAQGQFAKLAAGDTIAFCKGGAFTGNKSAWVNASCRANNVCTVRDYTPSWASSSTAMPKVTGGALSFANEGGSAHEEGYQFLNLEFDGSSGTGVFIYNDIKDVLLCNMVLNGYTDAIDAESALTPLASGSDGLNARITVRGSQILNNSDMGYIGACTDCTLEYNYFDHNGGNSPTQHDIYLEGQHDASGKSLTPTGEQIIGNEMHHSVEGSGTSCGGSILTLHGTHDQVLIQGNLIEEAQGTAQEGCWGIAVAPGGYSTPEGFTNVTILGNTVIGVGNAPIDVESCQNCVVADNLVIDTDAYGSGIQVRPNGNSSSDLHATAIQVLNNTVYAIGTEGTGITVGGEGTGYVIAGNAVVGTAKTQFNCFGFDLAASAYYSDYNLCWDASEKSASATWAKSMSLSAWQTSTGLDAHSLYADPMFKNPAYSNYDFTAMAGSPLIGAGDPTHGSTVDITGKTRPSPPDIGAYQN